MQVRAILVLISLGLFYSAGARAETDGKTHEKIDRQLSSPAPPSILPDSEDPTEPPPMAKWYRREFQSGMGLLLLGRPALTLNAQAHFLLNSVRPLYWGLDMTFSLPASGHYFALLPGLWYDVVLRAAPLAHFTFGALLGGAFSKGLDGLAPFAFSIFAEGSISFELDDLTTVRGQFRPGIVGGSFAFGMNVLIGFRFR